MGALPQRKEKGAGGEGEETTITCAPPIPSQKALTHEGGQEDDGRGWEAGRGGKTAGGWVGHHHHHQPDSWPRWLWRLGHLLWGRNQSGGSSDLPWEAKPPRRNSSRLVRVKKTRKYWPGTVALWEIKQFPKEHWAPYQETPLLMASPWDSPRSGQIWFALPREHHNMPAGSCRSIFGQSHGRHQPLHHYMQNRWQLCPRTFS